VNSENQLILDIIQKLFLKKITFETAQQVLNVSDRTIFRYLKKYEVLGVGFLSHGNSGKAPVNKTSEADIEKAKVLMKEKYFDFNLTHAMEKLSNDEGVKINRETFRRICHEINLVKKAKRRKSKVHKLRTRTAQAGVFLQMDGSPHRWFNNEVSCLIGAIDDASNENYYSEFFETETTVGCLKVLRKIIEKKGIFSILYVDRAGIFGGPKRVHFSQVKRALNELGINIIFASSAEAKGRIERHWQTLQDRMVPEMRIRKIKSYEAANDYLQEQFLPNDYNKVFKVIPADLEPGWKKLPTSINLDEIFCLKNHRSVKSDHTFCYNGVTYRITSNLKYSIQNQKVEVRIYLDQTQKIFFADKELEVEVYHPPVRMDVDEKVKVILEEKEAKKVRKDSHVEFGNKFYSVNPEFIGKLVVVREHGDNLLFYHHKKLIESHNKIKNPYVKNNTKPEHLKPWQATLLTTSVYRRAALGIGKNVDKLVFIILQKGQGVVDNKTIWSIIALKKHYTKNAIDESCEFAIATSSVSFRTIQAHLNLRYRKTMNE
jgi:hypothetical protein